MNRLILIFGVAKSKKKSWHAEILVDVYLNYKKYNFTKREMKIETGVMNISVYQITKFSIERIFFSNNIIKIFSETIF